MRLSPASRRPGTVVPLLAVSIVALLALVALAIDIGMVALARNHCQNAADSGAMAGVRTLTGETATNNNYTAATPAAQNGVAANSVLGTQLTTGAATVEVGYYAYNSSLQRFEATFSGSKPDAESWSAVRVTVASTMPTFFAKVFGINSIPAGATATAVHRPRDVSLILDYSGSMKYSCEPAYPSSGTITGSLNPDPAIPRFGHWSNITSVMQKTTDYIDGGGETHAPNNFTIDTDNGPPIVKDFLYRDSGGNLANAFHRVTSPYTPSTWTCPAPSNWDVQSDTTSVYQNSTGTGLGGDKAPMGKSALTTYARTVQEFLLGNNTTQSNTHAYNSTVTATSLNSATYGAGATTSFDPGPAAMDNPPSTGGYGPNYKGYSMGPGYFGKTFMHWPPDPRFHVSAATGSPNTSAPAKDTSGRWMADWRKRFFYNGGSSTPLGGSTAGADNRVDNTRLWDTSGNWQAASSSTYAINYTAVLAWLKAGPQVLPPNLRAGRVLYYTAIPNSLPGSGGTQDERFWRSYIDYVIGSGSSTIQQQTLYGRSTSAWGTMKVTAKSSLSTSSSTRPYMQYNDNPIRPRLHMWFGPMSMLCFLSDNNSSTYARNWLPGSCHESHCWQLKAGVNAALDDIQKNHPNDWVSMISFSGLQQYTTERVALSRDYTKMKNSLFFPFNTLDNLSDQNYEVRPYNSTLGNTAPGNVPNAAGSTSPECGFKVAYNQFSGRTGYSGRRGAAKMIIFETDGVPNTATSGNLTLGSPAAYNSYYASLTVGSNVGNNNSTVVANAKAALQAICNLDTHTTQPGYATARTPVRVHAIAFGDLFETTSTAKTQALQFMLDVQKIGSTSSSSATQIEDYKIIVGDYNTRIDKMKTAFERIMQSGVQVSLIK